MINKMSLDNKTLFVHQQQLNKFLIYFGYIHWFFLSLLLITGYLSGDILFIIGSFILASQNCIVLYSRHLIRKAEFQKSVTILCISLLVTSVMAVILYPWLYIVVVMVPIVVITISLPYLDHQLKILTAFCIICLFIVVLVGEFSRPLASYPPDIIIRVIRSSTGIGAALLLLILLFQLKTRLTTTIRSQMEAQLVAYQAQSANSQKSRFLAQMSHELRTPLNGVNPMLEALLMDIYGELNTKQRECVQRAYDSAKHLLVVINDVLDLAKVEAGRIDVQFSAQNMYELCHEVVNMLQSQAEKKNLVLRAELDSNLPIAWYDYRTIKQALLNLIGNAIKFTDEGQIMIAARHSINGYIQISISDTGIGILPEDQEKIWEAFTQVEDVLDRQQDGTGLGLTITKQLVEANGGSIQLESTVGQGSTFTIDIPALELIEKKLQQFSSIESSTTIVLVDDELTAHENTGIILNRSGWKMISVCDSTKALLSIEAFKPDIILLDLFMPMINGWEVLSLIRHHIDPQINTIPVVICSIDDDVRRRSLFTNVEYLEKPFEEHQLVDTISHILGGQHA